MDLIPASIANVTMESYMNKVTSRSRIIYWVIIGMTSIGLASLPFIYIDVSIQARGYFQSDIEKQTVCTQFQGKVIYSAIRKGGKIEKGDTLLIIDSESIKALEKSLNKRAAENNASISDLVKLTGLDSLDIKNPESELLTKRYLAEYRNLINQRIIQLQKYQKRKTEHERNVLLHNQKIIPDTDFENSLFILQSEKENLKQILLYQKNVWQSDLTQRRNEEVKFYADLTQCEEELSNRIVLAPISGTILQSTDVQLGSIVGPGQIIAEISPDGELVATCFVKPDAIGLINEKQDVRIQVDAFNYREWGMLPAQIIDISDDMITGDGTTAFFRIKCKPEQAYLSLKNGMKGSIKKGMSFNARIVVIRRSIYHLLFDKVDEWFNPYTYSKNRLDNVG
jgi:membrane fusion protein, peptide pheromone/bacteriocin exporter